MSNTGSIDLAASGRGALLLRLPLAQLTTYKEAITILGARVLARRARPRVVASHLPASQTARAVTTVTLGVPVNPAKGVLGTNDHVFPRQKAFGKNRVIEGVARTLLGAIRVVSAAFLALGVAAVDRWVAGASYGRGNVAFLLLLAVSHIDRVVDASTVSVADHVRVPAAVLVANEKTAEGGVAFLETRLALWEQG